MNRLAGEKGVSLVELLIVTSMLMVVLGAVLAIVDSMLGNYLYQSNSIESQDQVRQGMITMAKTIRQAERPLLLPINIPCNDLRFRADLNGNGVSEAIRYYLDDANNKVIRQETEATGNIDWATVPGNVAISNVVNNPTSQPLFTLSYISDLNQYNVRVITIRLFIDTNPGKPPKPAELSTDVQLRNFAQYQ